MKWFQHKANGQNGIRMRSACEEIGHHTAYSCFFRLLELFSERYDGGEPVVKLNIKTIKKTWKCSSKNAEKYLNCLSSNGLVFYKFFDNNADFLEVKIPEMSDFIDEYTRKKLRKSAQNPAKVRPKSGQRTERKSGQSAKKPKQTNPDNILTHWLSDLWNDQRGKLPEVRKITTKRLKVIKQRIKEYPDKKEWLEAIHKLRDSDFCNGLNDRSWVADFDFLMKPDSMAKILEGRYDNRRLISKADMNLYKNKKQAQRVAAQMCDSDTDYSEVGI
jgi:hypothetical protein